MTWQTFLDQRIPMPFQTSARWRKILFTSMLQGQLETLEEMWLTTLPLSTWAKGRIRIQNFTEGLSREGHLHSRDPIQTTSSITILVSRTRIDLASMTASGPWFKKRATSRWDQSRRNSMGKIPKQIAPKENSWRVSKKKWIFRRQSFKGTSTSTIQSKWMRERTTTRSGLSSRVSHL